ncbi:helix-turn-helix domain-containing protein [Geodermatophilus sp. SYSU D00708]
MDTRSSRTPTDGARPQRSHFATTDPDEAEAFIAQMYGAQADRAAFLRASPLAITQVSAGGLSSVDFTLPQELNMHLAGTDDLSVSEFVEGTVQAERGKEIGRYEAGDISLGAWPGGDYANRCSGVRVLVTTVPAAALAQAAGALPGDVLAPLRFPSMAPSSPAAREHWKRVAAFARGVLDDDEIAASPLVTGSVTRLLATSALAVFPNNRVATAAPTDHPATPATVRRAEEYIHAHAHADFGLTEIAAACHVTPRALQYAFARHHQMSPMRYVRRVRLARAHRDLLAADRTSGATVTGIAARWGFARPSRFAADYLVAYGTHPSQTLREGGG